MNYYNVVKPSFHINFWLSHFREFDDDYAREYEEAISSPYSADMTFIDTINDEYSDDISIDCIPMIERISERKMPESIKLSGADTSLVERSSFLSSIYNNEQQQIFKKLFK